MSPNNDLISRSALLEVIPEAVADEESNQNEIAYAEGWNDCLESFCSIVKYAPAVDAEVVRHGRWDSEVVKCRDWKGRQHDYFQSHSCSLCHKPDPSQGKSNYCPNCGAKMRGNVDASE